MTTFNELVTLEKDTCGKCGGVYALNKAFTDHARANRGGYNCPYCQTRWCWNESDADRLRKQLETRERELREAKCETLRKQQLLDAEQQSREKAEKKLRRVSNGVCPCCKRTFSNLARHMATKHAKHQNAKLCREAGQKDVNEH
jgi:1-aminocyclopropane-1-carboxylate deaminase/D-cysteine desulfhydrase-like pyridoxal-dependent ACC family enzyme